MHAVAAISLWILKLRGIDLVSTHAAPVYWHTYEMVFGFSRAAIFGFLFTAGQHWSGKFLLGGSSLLTLFLLWFAGRFAFFLPPIFSQLAFACDLAASLYSLYRLRALMAPQQKHNHNVVYLAVLFLLIQVGAVTAVYSPQFTNHFLHFVHLGLLVVAAFIVLIAGRVLPFFASAVTQGAKPRIIPRIEKFVWPMTLVTIVSFALVPLHPAFEKIAAFIFVLAAALHGIRWYYWKPLSTLKIPILAILYIGYLWLIAGLFLLALSLVGWIPASTGWHMLGIGAAGVFIFGMMTRVALGHTGRPIKAMGFAMAGYVTLNAALGVRVVMPLFGITDHAYLFAASLWIFTFIFYLMKYTPILFRSRIDGRPG